MALTKEQEESAKDLIAHINSNVNKSMEERFKTIDKTVEESVAFKEAMLLVKSLTDANKKSVEDVTKLQGDVKAFEDRVLAMKAKEESKQSKKFEKINKTFQDPKMFFEGMKRSLSIGLADLQSRKAFDKYKEKSIGGMTIYCSKARTEENGVKVDNPMSDSTSVVPIGTGIASSLQQFEPGLTRVTRRKVFIAQLVDLARTMSLFVSWMEQTNIDTGTAFSITQGNAGSGTYGSFRFTQQYIQVQNIQAMSKITNELLADLAQAQNEVQTEIIELLQLYLDKQILLGNGSAPQLKGILQYAQSIASGATLGLSVTAPNNYDAILAAILQIRTNGVASGTALGGEIINIFDPTDIVMHPADVAAMNMTKDTLNRYILDQMTYPAIQDGLGVKMIDGLRITENIGMTKGSVLVMDATKSHVRIREDAEIALGYVNTDFQDNMITVRGRIRAAHYIKNIQTNAFVSDTFANIKTAIGAI